MPETVERLRTRARAVGVAIPEHAEARLIAYFDLLYRWNAKINLTALKDSDEAIDRLLLEPISAALQLPQHPDLIDLGSGGGSPALPLALALKARRLIMVESRFRKGAFLREAARVVGLDATVECARFEDVADSGVYRGQMSIVSIRAVRVNTATLTVAKTFLEPLGTVALFRGSLDSLADSPHELFRTVRVAPLMGTGHLVLLKD